MPYRGGDSGLGLSQDDGANVAQTLRQMAGTLDDLADSLSSRGYVFQRNPGAGLRQRVIQRLQQVLEQVRRGQFPNRLLAALLRCLFNLTGGSGANAELAAFILEAGGEDALL